RRRAVVSFRPDLPERRELLSPVTGSPAAAGARRRTHLHPRSPGRLSIPAGGHLGIQRGRRKATHQRQLLGTGNLRSRRVTIVGVAAWPPSGGPFFVSSRISGAKPLVPVVPSRERRWRAPITVSR